ncbi:hypothetical protein [Microcella alkaliphila]|uniref:Uncharacterized protein n=1 Tax=Microcella alkaliphila TaxID=279828 RepID=A0A0U5BKM5_9MICO|nr:hypothetical protein [Microcella alkaliphila]BAU32101.1 putative uncharacterized protein [Microcella alkaliphila]
MTTITWSVVPGVPHLALVGRNGTEVVATIETDGILRYRLIAANGRMLGRFESIGEAQAALHTFEIEREMREGQLT